MKILSYEEFKAQVLNHILSYLPDSFNKGKVMINSLYKNNVTLDALTVKRDENSNMIPNVYLNHIYDGYQKNPVIDDILNQIASQILKGYDANSELPIPEIERDFILNNVTFALVNTDSNKEMLKEIPNRPFLDLSIIYKYVVSDTSEEIGSITVRNDMLETTNLNEQELYDAAIENTKRVFPLTVKNLQEVIRSLFIDDGISEEFIDDFHQVEPEQIGMYVISNERGINGSVNILFAESFSSLAEELDSDLYILPSSIHELLALSVNEQDRDALATMVNDVNMTQVKPEERLSNSVYFYSKVDNKISIAR